MKILISLLLVFISSSISLASAQGSINDIALFGETEVELPTDTGLFVLRIMADQPENLADGGVKLNNIRGDKLVFATSSASSLCEILGKKSGTAEVKTLGLFNFSNPVIATFNEGKLILIKSDKIKIAKSITCY